MMTYLTFVCVVCSAADNCAGFAPETQTKAVTATVQIEDGASGVIIGRSGPLVYILTAAHCVADRRQVAVTTFTAGPPVKRAKTYRRVQVVARAPNEDLALLALATSDELPEGVRVCPLAAVPQRRVRALTVGCDKDFPTCYGDDVQGRKVIRKKLGDQVVWFWEANTSPAIGRSGGPLLDADGRLLGVCSAGYLGNGYYCHTDEIHKFLQRNAYQWLVEESGAAANPR